MSGTTTCSRGETFDLAVRIEQEQKARRTPTLVQASRIVPIICETTAQPWIVQLAPPSGQAFKNGAALASVESVNVAAGVTSASTSAAVHLQWLRK